MVPAVSDSHPSKQPPHSQGRTTAADEGCGCGAQESCQCVRPPGWEMPSSRHTNGWLEPWVCTVCTHTIDHLYYILMYHELYHMVVYGCIWLYMVVYGCFSGNMRIIHWFYGGPPLPRTFRGGPCRQGPLFWEWKFGGLRNGRTPELEKSGFDSYG